MMHIPAKLIILDRDGVINYESENYIKSPEEWHAIPGSLEAIASLKKAGFIVVVATNQSGIGREFYTEKDVMAIHDKMQRELATLGGKVDAIFFCPHAPDDHCNCRKPKPGMLKQIKKQFHVNLCHALYIGDSLRDLQAAQAMDCPFALVKTGYGEQAIAAGLNLSKDAVFDDLASVVKVILNNDF